MGYTYKKDHIPTTTPCNRRPALKMNASTITIHNTGNEKSTARNERNWLTNSSNDKTASYHIVIDSIEAIECLPLNENAWHSGDGSSSTSGNRTSIGIEICESGDYELTLKNAVDLVAKMLKERGWSVDRLRRHWDWKRPSDGYRKICPRLMYDNGSWAGWDQFKNRVAEKLKEDEPMTKDEKQAFDELKTTVQSQNKAMMAFNEAIKKLEEKNKMSSVPEWAMEAVEVAVKAGLVDTPEGGSYDFYRLLTVLHRKKII